MVVGFLFLRYIPLRKKLSQVESRYKQAHSGIAAAAVQRQQLPKLKDELSGLRETCGNYSQRIPSKRNLGGFLHTIADLMQRHNLKDHLIKPGPETSAGQLKVITINMQCRGKLAEIFEFYKSLQGLQRMVRIESVSLGNDKDFKGRVSMRTQAVIYYQSNAEQG